MKNSYMDKKNILSEGFFDTLRKYLVKYPAIKKNKKFKSNIKSLNNQLKRVEDLMNKERQKKSPKTKKVKLSKFKLSDLIK